MTAAFITSTGTDIGKTFVARGLIRRLRAQKHTVAALKPVLSGFDEHEAAGSDPGLLIAALGRPVTMDEIACVSPWRFAAPVSPHIAARREDRDVDFTKIVEFCRTGAAGPADFTLIEGAGGIMTPVDDRHTMLDLMEALSIPLILVTGSYLGTISHTLTALDAAAHRGLTVAALVVSETEGSAVPLDETISALAQFAPAPRVIALPRLPRGAPDHPAFGEIVAALSPPVSAGRAAG